MLRVTVELIPFGNEVRKRPIGVLEITNTGEGDIDSAYYKVTLMKGTDVAVGVDQMKTNRVTRGTDIFRFLLDILQEVYPK